MVVEEIEEILCEEQKADLDDQLSAINPTLSMIESLLVNQFATARTFIHSCLAN